MAASKYVTVMLIPDGAESRRGFRIKQWVLKFVLGFIAFLIVGIIVFFAFYGKVLTRAATADKLARENQRLLRYQYKVQLLEDNLVKAREIVTRLTQIAGINIDFPEIPDDSTIFASVEQKEGATVDRPLADNLSLPSGMPIQGFITQDFDTANDNHYHPGIDIACAIGTPVLATASGTVEFADYDSTYGYMVVLRHNDSVETVYGHNEQLLVKKGQKVMAGARLALSGNTGISTAPHLHYEIRINDEPIDPLENPYDKKNQQ
jgi:murein DD-endopeptidase MepM/ murein hydrolase activator NlpD